MGKVSVLIPAWKEAKGLTRVLARLNHVRYHDWETLIVAGGDDGTFELAERLAQQLRSCPVKVLRQQPNGKNAALNVGLQEATGEVIVILDADTLVDPTWLTELMRPLESGIEAACGNYYPVRNTAWAAFEQAEKVVGNCVRQQGTLQGSGSIAIERNALERAGGFPETVKVGVDFDLDLRCVAAGLRKAFVESSHVLSERPATLAEVWRNEVRWRRAHLRLLLAHHGIVGAPRQSGALHYIFAIGFLLLVGTSALLAVSGLQYLAMASAAIGLLLWLQIAERKARLFFTAGGYLDDRRFFARAWVPLLWVPISYVATWYSLFTLRRTNVHFKGPRAKQ
jgi:cellulose synthase/poly-beta-1,6-N-acetylglucosamine synthase-like glycosyltransferase